MLYPLFLKLDGAPTLVVGAGTIAKHKAESLLSCGALVTMVAPDACPDVLALAAQGRVCLERRGFLPQDVDGKRLVIAATSLPEVNEAVMQRCRACGVLVNVVDDPARCDFYVPSVVERGRVQVAISTGGASPALARLLKAEIAAVLEPTLGTLRTWCPEPGNGSSRSCETKTTRRGALRTKPCFRARRVSGCRTGTWRGRIGRWKTCWNRFSSGRKGDDEARRTRGGTSGRGGTWRR